MEFFEVKNKIYTSPDDLDCRDGEHWEPAKPVLYSPNIFDRIRHAFGKHWSWGQPFCVICGKERGMERRGKSMEIITEDTPTKGER